MLKRVVCWGVVLGICAVRADALVIEAGESVVHPTDAKVLPQLTGTGVLSVRSSGKGLQIIIR